MKASLLQLQPEAVCNNLEGHSSEHQDKLTVGMALFILCTETCKCQ